MSTTKSDFSPLWASPPSDTIRAALRERGLTIDEFGLRTSLGEDRIRAILAGSEPLTIDTARRISSVIGGSVEFWISRDGQYRDDNLRLLANRWAEELPTIDMATFGWIEKPTDWKERVTTLLDFFDVPDVNAWEKQYFALVSGAHLRAAKTKPPVPGSLAVWLRQAEREAKAAPDLGTWDRAGFLAALPVIRGLTRERDPKSFVPKLQGLCSPVGVHVAVVRAPKGCSVSGAARFVTPAHASIALTARYLTDDHFWFTFFHEAAHLLLHGHDQLYVDDLSSSESDHVDKKEREADNYAGDVLVPPSFRTAMVSDRRDEKRLVRFAKEVGVAPGIIVGQLQHRGMVGYASGLNHLKRRFKWVGPNLERA